MAAIWKNTRTRARTVVTLLVLTLLVMQAESSATALPEEQTQTQRSEQSATTSGSHGPDNGNVTISEEKRLTKFLLARYEEIGRGGRPVVNTSEPTHVIFGLGLIQMDLDERNKILTTSMWSRLSWKDLYMQWEPDDFGGVHAIRLESDQVWLPDIMLYNTADPEGAARNALVVVFSDGTMQWVPHQIFRSSCSIDVSNFPFDRQQCHMWFGSWTHHVREIDLALAFDSGIDLGTFQSDYKDSCEWDIASSKAEKMLLPPNDTNPIAVLSFSLNLERKLVFSSYILTLPCVFLASLTLVVFCLPPDRPDRTGLAMNLFQSFLVLLLILVEAAPPTASSIPVLGVYYCFNLVIIMLSIYLSSLVVNIHRAEATSKPVPYAVRVIILRGLGSMMCLPMPDVMSYVGSHHSNNNSSSGRTANLGDAEVRRGLLSSQTGVDQSVRLTEIHGFPGKQEQQGDLSRHLLDIKNTLQLFNRSAEKKEQRADAARRVVTEWRQVARVLDRFFFLLYLVGIVISLVFLFPKPPKLR